MPRRLLLLLVLPLSGVRRCSKRLRFALGEHATTSGRCHCIDTTRTSDPVLLEPLVCLLRGATTGIPLLLTTTLRLLVVSMHDRQLILSNDLHLRACSWSLEASAASEGERAQPGCHLRGGAQDAHNMHDTSSGDRRTHQEKIKINQDITPYIPACDILSRSRLCGSSEATHGHARAQLASTCVG